MIDFSELFIEAEGEPIEYEGKTLIMADEISIEKNFKAEIELISVDSQWRQGISFGTKGKIVVGDNEVGGAEYIFWQELWTELNEGAIPIKGESKNGILMIYNSWEWEGCQESWVNNGAMIKETIGKHEYIYHCNDRDWDDDFDDLVFRLKILEGARED